MAARAPAEPVRERLPSKREVRRRVVYPGRVTIAPSAPPPPSRAEQEATSKREPRPGEVFTRDWVVELILDLCGYTPDVDLTALTFLDPAVGAGAFLRIALDRLLDAREKHHEDQPWLDLRNAVKGFDIEKSHVYLCRRLVELKLIDRACPVETAQILARRWITEADFLLQQDVANPVDYIVGNPPYVRIEDIPADTLKAYRTACSTMTGRADIYIGFFEKALDLLKPEGKLAFICADRWMRNQYGRALRAKVVEDGFAMDTCLTMHDVAAFETDVAAYPAITVLRRGTQGRAIAGDAKATFDATAATRFAAWAREEEPAAKFDTPSTVAARLPHWHKTIDSWPEGSPATIAWLEDLADRLPLLEDDRTGTLIRIGAATGADKVYVTRDQHAAEYARMLPLAMAADIKSGTFSWTGNYLVSPWDKHGLVDLEDWQELRSYYEDNASKLRARAVAKNNEKRWYRTIDRVTLAIVNRPKLLLEDMKAKANPVLSPGGYYPHHNLYYLVSRDWDLNVLGGLLLSSVVERQVAAYCVKMRGNTLRFQAQYLRRVRVPHQADISTATKDTLRTAFKTRDRQAATKAALHAYGIESLPS